MKYDYSIFNEESNIAIVTLWTKKEVIIESLKESNLLDKVHMIGTLYSTFGIHYLLQTIGNSNINTIIMCGADLSESGSSLLKIFKGKTDALRFKEDISELLSSRTLLDARFSPEKLSMYIHKHFCTAIIKKYRLTIDDIPEHAFTESFPSILSGNIVYDPDVFRAWIKILDNIARFGIIKSCSYSEKQKQFLNNICTIPIFNQVILEDFCRMFKGYFTVKEIQQHVDSLLCAVKPAVAYTYGQRLHKQIQMMVQELKKISFSRRAVGISWRENRDRANNNPPCLLLIQGDVTNEFYNHTAYFRSNDMVKAFPINMIGQIFLANHIASSLSLSVGTVTLISSSAHIYEHDFSFVSRLLHAEKNKLYEFVQDPKGNLIFNSDEIKQMTSNQVLWNLNEEELTNENLYTLPSHALFAGKELVRRNLKQ